jgi:hypothetical protein
MGFSHSARGCGETVVRDTGSPYEGVLTEIPAHTKSPLSNLSLPLPLLLPVSLIYLRISLDQDDPPRLL